MSVDANITDPRNKRKAYIDDKEGEDQALVVATRPLKEFYSKVDLFTNSTYGSEMAQIAATGSNTLNIYNGENSYWTFSNVSDNQWEDDDTEHVHNGTYSLTCTNGGGNNDECQFEAVGYSSMSDYSALQGWIYITDWDSDNQNIRVQAYDTGESTYRGNYVDIGDYINETIFNIWHKFIIPLSDLEIESATDVNALRFKVIDIGPGSPPDVWIDDVYITASPSSALEYKIEPDKETWLYVNGLRVTYVDAYDASLANASVGNLSYDKILGATLPNGWLFQRIQDKEITASWVINNLADTLSAANNDITNIYSDGTNTIMTTDFKYIEPEVLKSENEDKLKIIIRDDMSQFISMKASIIGYTEDRS